MEGCRFTTSLSDLVELARHTLTTHPGLTFSGGALQAVRRQRPGGLPQRWIPPPLAGMAKIREKARLYVRGTSHVRAARADMQANDRLFTEAVLNLPYLTLATIPPPPSRQTWGHPTHREAHQHGAGWLLSQSAGVGCSKHYPVQNTTVVF